MHRSFVLKDKRLLFFSNRTEKRKVLYLRCYFVTNKMCE